MKKNLLLGVVALLLGVQQAGAKSIQQQETIFEPRETGYGSVLIAELVLAVDNGTLWAGATALPEASDVLIEAERVVARKTPPWREMLTLRLGCAVFPSRTWSWAVPLVFSPYCEYGAQPLIKLAAGTYDIRMSFTYKGQLFSLLAPNISVVVLDGSR